MPNPMSLELATSVQDRVPRVNAEIVSLDELEEMSLSEVNQAKAELKRRREQLHLQLDQRKLKQTKTIMDRMERILDVMGDKLMEVDVPTQDVKFLTDAYKTMLTSFEKISRLDSVDGTGKAAMLSIEVRYKEG